MPSEHLLIAYYQQMPPFAGGTALRGGSVMPPLAQLWERSTASQNMPPLVQVLTMVGDDPGSGVLRYLVLTGSRVNNQSGLVVRLLGELLMGLRAATHVVFKQPSGVLLSSPGYWPCVLIAVACRLSRIPYLLDVRDLYPEVYLHSGLLSAQSIVYRGLQAITRWWYRGAAAIAVATEGLESVVLAQSRRSNGSSPSIEVVYNGFPTALQVIRPRKHERFTVVFHGVLGFFQDIETLCLLAQRLMPHGIDMIAIGYGKKEKMLRECKSPNLRFLGGMDHESTMTAVAQCHLGLCLRLDDGISKDAFPVKVWEYLGLGMPCIVTPTCEAGEFLQLHGCGVQMTSGNLDALEATIVGLRDQPERLSAMAARISEAARTYTREQMGEQLAQFVMRNINSSK
jgi:glycosyltransferase involved in cell wall biosynthesis